jgi:hypothetical protein
MKPNVTVSIKTSSADVVIRGAITETTAFPELVNSSLALDRINVQFEGALYLNSGGVRGWIAWIQDVSLRHPDSHLYLYNIPTSFAFHATKIDGFLPVLATVQTVSANYYCPSCDNIQIETISANGVDKDNTSILTSKCKACSSMAELDAIPEHVFKLLKM